MVDYYSLELPPGCVLMHPLVTELNLWFDHEKVNPDIIMEDDPKLLGEVNKDLAAMRILLAKEWNDELYVEYKLLYTTLCDLLMFRLMKLK